MSDLYAYTLPQERIAKAPTSPRDACQLLVYNTATNEVHIDRFYNIAKYLPSAAFLVMNDTHVVPARLYCSSDTKQKIEVFILMNELQPNDTLVRCMVDRTVLQGQRLHVIGSDKSFEVASKDRQYCMLKPLFPLEELESVLLRYGTTPIPKYIRETPLTEDILREKYQTVFAHESTDKRAPQSVAAPTAALHFTTELLEKLEGAGVPQLMVTLHVGLGTFAPISQENIDSKKLFNEYYQVSAQTAGQIAQYKQARRSLIAVGTTAVRTLESYARTPEYTQQHGINSGTDLFIFPPYQFTLVDGLVTNFHLPSSSLMMLVAALLEHKHAKRTITELYEIALKHNFYFYSFGDAMLIV